MDNTPHTALTLADALAEAEDTLRKLRADLAEEDADRHAQRIAVIDLTLDAIGAPAA